MDTQGELQEEGSWSAEGGKLAHCGVTGVRDETEKPGMPPGGVRDQVSGQRLLRRTRVLSRDCPSVTSLHGCLCYSVFLSFTSFLMVLRKPWEGKGLVCRAFGDNWRRREMAPNHSLVEGDLTF